MVVVCIFRISRLLLLIHEVFHLLKLLSFATSLRGGLGNKVRRQLADGSTAAPDEGLQPDGLEDGPHADGHLVWSHWGALGEVIKSPSAWEHAWHSVALIGSQSHLDDVWPQVEDECMETSSQTNRAGDTQAQPVEEEEGEIHDSVSVLLKRTTKMSLISQSWNRCVLTYAWGPGRYRKARTAKTTEMTM